jgi:predicted XRE-type DNA-binding protein
MRHFSVQGAITGQAKALVRQNRISLLQIARSRVPELARFRIKFSAFFLVTFQTP